MTRRKPGRPKGTPAPRKSPSNAGRPPGGFSAPSLAEVLRMRAVEVMAARMPVSFRFIDEAVLERLENQLERTFEAVLREYR